MPNNPNKKYDVFIGYSEQEEKFAKKLAKFLMDSGLRVFLDKWELVPGDETLPAIAEAIRNSRVYIALVGPDTPSWLFKQELQKALDIQSKDSSFRVIPVSLRGADLASLGNFIDLRVRVDLRNGMNDKQALDLLISGIKGVAPGPPTQADSLTDETEDENFEIAIRKLKRVRKLRELEIIEREVQLYAQKDILKRYILEDKDDDLGKVKNEGN